MMGLLLGFVTASIGAYVIWALATHHPLDWRPVAVGAASGALSWSVLRPPKG
jgi:hypothetical protein